MTTRRLAMQVHLRRVLAKRQASALSSFLHSQPSAPSPRILAPAGTVLSRSGLDARIAGALPSITTTFRTFVHDAKPPGNTPPAVSIPSEDFMQQQWAKLTAQIEELNRKMIENEERILDEKTSDSLRDSLQRINQRLETQINNCNSQLNNVTEAMKNITEKMQGAPQTPAAPVIVFDSGLEWVEKMYGRNGNNLQDRLVDLRPTSWIPREGRSEQVTAIWNEFVTANRMRKPLVFISGVGGSGKTSVARYFAEKDPKDIDALPDEQRPFTEATQMVAISFNGDTPAGPIDQQWIQEKRYNLPVVARVLFRQQSNGVHFDTFCSKLDVAIKSGQLDFDRLDVTSVLQSIVNMTKPTILIVDELAKLSKYGEEKVEEMRSRLCAATDDLKMPDFFVLFTSLHAGLMKKEFTDSSNRPVIPITLPALTFEQSRDIFAKKLDEKFMWHKKNTLAPADDDTIQQAASYLAAVSGGHPRSIELLLAAAKETKMRVPLHAVADVAARKLARWYPAMHDYPSELLYHVFLGREVQSNWKPFANHPDHELAKFTFDDLVSDGMLLNSLGSRRSFQPMLNMLALRMIVRENNHDGRVIKPLDEIIRIMDTFDAREGTDLEKIHLLWEALRRYSAFKLNKLDSISIREYYGNPDETRARGKLINAPAQFNAPLEVMLDGDLVPGPSTKELPQTRFKPTSATFPGMDAALFVPAFGQAIQAATERTQQATAEELITVPLSIQHKFSKPGSTKYLNREEIEASYDNAMEKMEAANWKRSQCVHIIITWDRLIAKGGLKHFPENGDRHVMILDKACLREPLGPIASFLDHAANLQSIRLEPNNK